jgi:hypothetical protein
VRPVILALLAASTFALAQPKPDLELPANVRMYSTKNNLTRDRAVALAQSIRNLLNNNVNLSWDDTLHVFVIKGEARDMDTAETLLKRFDIADPTIELTVYLVRAYSTPVPDFVGGQLRTPTAPAEPARAHAVNPVPPDVKSAIDEMKSTLNYEHYSLWDSMVLRPTTGGGQEQGSLTLDFSTYTYSISVTRASFESPLAENKTLYLQNLWFSLTMPPLRARGAASSDPPESHIHTDLTLQAGKKIVLGRIHLLPAGNGDVFLVLSTKVN